MKRTIKRILALIIIFTLSLTLLLGTSIALAGDEPGESAGEGRHWEKQLVEAAHDVLICKKDPHTHDDECYSLTCKEHVHDGDCYAIEAKEHECDRPHSTSGDNYVHNRDGRSCTKKSRKWYYTTTESVLTCDFDSEHTHSGIPGDCYMLTCDYEEEHSHGSDCYEHVEDRYEWVSVRDKGTVELTVTYSDSSSAVKNKEVTLTDVDGNTYETTTDDSGVAVFTAVNTGAVTFASISYTSSNRTYTGTPAGVTLQADGDTVQASVNLALILTGKADHVDLRMQNASITVNTNVVEASDSSNILSTSTTTTTASVIAVAQAVITWNNEDTQTITGFAPRPGYTDYEFSKSVNVNNIQDIKSVDFTIQLKDADDNEYDNAVVSYDQAGVQFAAINCDGYRDGKISGLDFDVETVANLIIEKTITTNKVIKVTKVWDDKDQELDHPPVDITVTQTCGETEVSDTKTLDSSSAELLFGFFELEGDEYTYTVSEAPVSGYSMSGGIVAPVDPEENSNFDYEATLTNTYVISEETTSFEGTKVWSDSEKVEHNNTALTLTLYADGTAVQATPVWDGDLFYFHDLPKFKEVDGELVEIIYTVIETPPQNYRASYSGEGNFCENGDTITNTYYKPTPPTVVITYGTLTVDKTAICADAAATAGTEPFSFTVTFTANPWSVSSVTNNAGLLTNNGVYTFTLTADAPAVVFSNIPAGTLYTVTETISAAQDEAGWTQGTVTGANGSIPVGGATASFENVLTAVAGANDDDTTSDNGSDDGSDEGSASNNGQQVAGDVSVLPQTGGISPSTLLGIFGLALIVIGSTVCMFLRKKRNHGEATND